jgi:predicted amidohydrolase
MLLFIDTSLMLSMHTYNSLVPYIAMVTMYFVVPARAIENQCYVIAAAQYGQHNEKRMSYGHSLVVDGWGTIIADAGGMDSESKPPSTQPIVMMCDIDLSTIDSIRERMPIQQHRTNAHLKDKL